MYSINRSIDDDDDDNNNNNNNNKCLLPVKNLTHVF